MTELGRIEAGATVVGIDGSSGSSQALEWAMSEARLDGGDIELVYGLVPLSATQQAWMLREGIIVSNLQRDARHDAEALLHEKQELVAQRCPDVHVTTRVCDQDPRGAMIELSRSARRLVVGSRGHGLIAGLLLGSVSHALTRTAHCPVVVVCPPAPHHASGPDVASQPGVVVGLSTMADTHSTLAAGFVEAARHGVPLVVALCVWDGYAAIGGWDELSPDSLEYDELWLSVSDALDQLRRDYPAVSSSVLLARGAVDECFLDLSRGRDLLVVGRHGAHALWGISGMGSIAKTVVEHAHLPVMVIP